MRLGPIQPRNGFICSADALAKEAVGKGYEELRLIIGRALMAARADEATHILGDVMRITGHWVLIRILTEREEATILTAIREREQMHRRARISDDRRLRAHRSALRLQTRGAR